MRPEPSLGLEPVTPADLLSRMAGTGDGGELEIFARGGQRAVEDARRERPGWNPRKEPTMLDPLTMSDEESAHLAAWLAGREADFPRWTAAYAPSGAWDFSRESLGALEEVVRRVVPVAEDVHRPADRDFVDGAVWYCGEVMRHGMGGRWFYSDASAGSRYDFPQLDEIGPRDNDSKPDFFLVNAIDQPGYLARRYDDFAGPEPR